MPNALGMITPRYVIELRLVRGRMDIIGNGSLTVVTVLKAAICVEPGIPKGLKPPSLAMPTQVKSNVVAPAAVAVLNISALNGRFPVTVNGTVSVLANFIW